MNEAFQLMWQWYMHSKTIALRIQNFVLFKNHPITNFIWSHMFYNPIICFILLSRPRWEKQLWYIIMFHFFTLLWPKYRKKGVFTPKKEKSLTLLLYQTYVFNMVGLSGLEPPTLRLSSARSNQLSKRPNCLKGENYLTSKINSCQQ